MTELVGGIAPLGGSLTLLVADGRTACAWRGAEEVNDPIAAFHEARHAGGAACAPVRFAENGAGWLVRLGGMPRDATVFRQADDELCVVGPYWEPEEGREVSARDASEMRRLVAESGGERVGTLDVPSGQLFIAHAWGDLTGAIGKPSPLIPPEIHAQLAAAFATKAERRGKILRNLEEVRKRLAETPDGDRAEVVEMLESVLEYSAEGASAHLALFGGTSAVIRKDTGDLLLVVPAGTYALVLRSLTFRQETVGILRLLPA